MIVDGPACGSWNMAVDEALLQTAATIAEPTLRVYQWTPATLSLGYFQSYADRETHPASAVCPLVRRRSGGGAIMHDAEITYALTLPITHPAARDPVTLYLSVHQGVIHVLRSWGLRAELYSGEPADAPFLCFHRRSVGDLLVDSYKVLGSAQRRARSAVLQHGSLLLRRSPFAPSLPGVIDLGGDHMPLGQAVKELTHGMLGALGMKPLPGQLSAVELAKAREGANDRFVAESWNRKR